MADNPKEFEKLHLLVGQVSESGRGKGHLLVYSVELVQ